MILALPFVQALIEMVVAWHARPVPVRIGGQVGAMRRYEITDLGAWADVRFPRGRGPSGWYPAEHVILIQN